MTLKVRTVTGTVWAVD